ncbi:MAG: DoxX family protein [Prevotellaceae bacterium]|jgi:uncharacterized membrane protein YphA (DoxX/SURF4 family)|nr:DoxX family protein [Prevotellaceae bacterium]
MNYLIRTGLIVCRLIMGALFTFSGFVKAIDPLGTTYKFGDYFEAFHMTFFEPTSLYLAVLQNAAELVIGLCLIMGIRMRLTAWATLLFMAFYTVLTFFLAIFNPVSDCGCFGDAIKLTNWQTFFKNLILIVPALLVFWGRNKYKNFATPALEWFYVALFFLATFWLSAHCYKHLPPLDFMPYHVGQNIPQAMAIPEGAPRDEYQTILIYEKDGVQQEFSDTDFPWQDSTWVFVDSKSKLVKQGYVPAVYNFSITHPEQGDITELVLESEYAFLLVAPKLEKASTEYLESIKFVADFAKKNGYTFYGLTSSTQGYASEFSSTHGLNFELCSTDETTLKSMVRAHPGLMLLYRGTVVGKWSARDIPSVEKFEQNSLAGSINLLREANESRATRLYIFAAIIAMLLLVMASPRKKEKR